MNFLYTINRHIKQFFLIAIICFIPQLSGLNRVAFAGEVSVINACQLKALGTLRIVSDSSKCIKNLEVSLSWNVIGPAGPQGDKGDPGVAGAAGPKGDKGDPGAAGLGFATADDAKLMNVLRYDGADTVTFTGVNVQIVNGEGKTYSLNGLGNLIIGYNEPSSRPGMRTGSHNLVMGNSNDYTQHSGIVAGVNNIIQGSHAKVLGGLDNIASGEFSIVIGGMINTASGVYSSVSGGRGNTASGAHSSAGGGNGNTASGIDSSVSGGSGNTASGDYSSVSGGNGSTASGYFGSVSGGHTATASGDYSSVSGGVGNTASGSGSSVSGGFRRQATTPESWAAGTYSSP